MEVKKFKTEYDSRNNLTYLGESIFARNEQGNLKHHIMTIFPRSRFIVTEPSTLHGDQCNEYIYYLNTMRANNNAPPLSDEQRKDIVEHAVSISIIEGEGERFFAIIRPDPNHIRMAFEADDLLQQLLPKFRIFFMHTDDKIIRWAIRERGESWRIQPLPKTKEGMRKTVINNKMTLKLSQRRIYYYNMQTGARHLTYESFCKLNELDCETLRAFLLEIQKYSPLKNREGYSEILFFKANHSFTSDNFQRFDFTSMDESALRAAHSQLCQEFENALIDPFYKKDDYDNWDWLFSIFSIIANLNRFSTEEYQMGLCEEFSLKITWLPGGRINQDGGIIKDPVYQMKDQMTPSERARFEDGVPQMILFTYVRESFLIEYANIGLVPPIRSSQSTKEISFDDGPKPRRSVYIMQVKLKDEKERLSIIRLQKWDIREMLDEGKELLESFNQAEEYTDYILNRRLACNLLKMKLPQYLKVRRFVEVYHGKNPKYQNVPIHTVYYEREYIDGIATDRLTPQYFQNPKNGAEFSIRFARLLGEAVAPNLIVGRSDKDLPDKPPIFDDGDEVLQLDKFHMPDKIIVSEQPGTFVYYLDKMENQIAYYAKPMIKRASFIPNFKQTVDAYVEGFVSKFRDIQGSAKQYRGTFDDLPNKAPGSMFDKWRRVLDRLETTNPDVLADMLYKAIYEGVENNA